MPHVQKQVSLDPGACSKHVPAGAAAAEEVIRRRQSMDFGDAEKGETKVSENPYFAERHG